MDPLQHPGKVRRALADWFAQNRRDLPWRVRRSLYRTVVSEFMLQQTQVKTVVPYFERWMRRFPDFKTLAAADPDEVLRHWEGLGYYRRARSLHRLAQAIADAPHPPATPSEWARLPGVGTYTAAAIASIGQGHPAAVVDGNVIRILARLAADTREFTAATAAKIFAPAAQALLDPASPGPHNEAMMELGATVCLKRAPQCHACPLATFCAAARRGDPKAIPNIRRQSTVALQSIRLWIQREDRLLLHRIPENASRLAGQYELPPAELLGGRPPAGAVRAVKSRGITRYRITETILQPRWTAALKRRLLAVPNLHWVDVRHLDTITLSGPHRRWVRELLPTHQTTKVKKRD